jgi:hypothetical protein
MSRSLCLLPPPRFACMACYGKTSTFGFNFLYRPMFWDVGDRPITAKIRILSQTARVGFAIHTDSGTGFFFGHLDFPCQYNSTIAP